MFYLTEYDHHNNFRKLANNENMFHNALEYVLKGEKRFHVEYDTPFVFDLIYQDNDEIAKSDHNFPDSDFFKSEIIIPPYYKYDENDLDKINMEIFDGFDEVFFEQANEYSIVIAKLILDHTNLKVTFSDFNINLIPWLKDRINSNNKPLTDNYIYVQRDFYPVYDQADRFCTLELFHSLFILQWISDLPRKDLKYVSFAIRKTEGIGSILSTFSKVSAALSKHGIKAYIEPSTTRFSDDLLSKYFMIGDAPEDSNINNTGYVSCFNTMALNYFIQGNEADISLDILKPEFIKEMKEYTDQVIGDKKVLGVLLRGTDIVIANYVGAYRPVEIEDSIKYIEKRVNEDNYDKIFVATEDRYYLEKMVSAFPGKIIAVSQERHEVKDFKDVKYISDLEKKMHKGDAYKASVEDTTVNYFYAMYLLSRCESFISNCMCNGVNIVRSFNQNKFNKDEILSIILK